MIAKTDPVDGAETMPVRMRFRHDEAEMPICLEWGAYFALALLTRTPAPSDSPARGSWGRLSFLRSEFLFHSAPFKSCHAATIAETRSGTLVAAWFGGSHESAPDVGIYLSTLEAMGWSTPRRIAGDFRVDGVPQSCYNPVLFQASKGPLMLFFKVGTGPQTWKGKLMTSQDDGRTWSAPRDLPEGIFGPIKNRPIELEGGRILCPSSTESAGWRVHMEWTDDLGETWSKTPPLNDGVQMSAIQPSLLRLSKGALRAIGRTRQGRMFQMDSVDVGRTWGAMTLSSVPNPNSGSDALTLKDGTHLLVYNDSDSRRSPLCVALSKDGSTWTKALTLEEGRGEFSYPTVIQTRDRLVHVVYTWNRVRIRHVVLQLVQG